MSSPTSHAHVLNALLPHYPEDVAQGQLERALRHAGFTAQAEYTPEELAALGHALVELSLKDLQGALPELDEIPGPAEH